MENPLSQLIITNLKPCNCGGMFGKMLSSGAFVCIPQRPHFKSNRVTQKKVKPTGLGIDLRYALNRMSEQQSNLGVLAKSILRLDEKL